MGDRVRRFKKTIRTIVLIIRNREFQLLFYLSSIDDDYLAHPQSSRNGRYERSFHPLFDPVYYRSQYLDRSYHGNPFIHFLTKGFAKRYRPGPFFDYDVYQQSTDWQPGFGNPLKHYLSSEKRWGRPGIFFDIDWYKDKTPALYKSSLDPVKHYKLYGSKEGKSPIPQFDPQFYNQFMQGEQGLTDSLTHYLTFGIGEGYPPSSLFDPLYYKERYSSELGACSPFEHYLREGVYAGNYIAERVKNLHCKPLISIIVPVYNTDPCFLNNCIRSVLYQQYPHWQLCLADDGSSRKGIKEQLEYWLTRDERIKAIFFEQNQGISAASNSAAALADGEYLGFLDNDDELAPDCLYYVAETISKTSADVIYTDEDLVGDDGRRFSVFHKPDFNRVLLYSHNYITHFVTVSRKLFLDCHGFRSQFDGAQDLDFMLRVTDHAEKVVHIPKILYHWRATQTSTSINHTQKGYAHEAGKNALHSYFEQNKNDVMVQDGDINYSYRLRKKLNSEASVTALIWCNTVNEEISHVERLKNKTEYGRCDFVLIAEGKKGYADQINDPTTLIAEGIYRTDLKNDVKKTQGFSETISSVDSDYLIFLDSSVIDVDGGWVEELVSQMTLTNVGCVCGRFSYNGGDGPSYTVPDLRSESPGYYHQFLTSCSRHSNGLHCQQLLLFAPWDICIVRRSDYEKLGGFDYENYPAIFAMTDFALRAAREGLDIIYTPYARVYGQHSGTGQTEVNLQSGITEKRIFQKTWRDILRQNDPYYNLGILDEHNIDRDAFKDWFTGDVF